MRLNVYKFLLTTLISVFTITVGYSFVALNEPVVYSGNFPNGLIVTADNAIVTDADIQNPNGNGLVIHANNVLIDDVIVHNVQGHGIIIEDHHNVTLRNSTIYDTVKGTCYPSCSGGWSSAVKIRSSNETDKLAYGILIENNLIFENFGEGLGMRGSQIIVRNNTLYDNFSVNIYSNSDNVLVEKNYVYCTTNSKFYRDGLPATGIGVSQESFTNWSGHAYNQTVINNIVNGCKNGFVFNNSEVGVTPTGLRNSTIAYNTFANTYRMPIRIDYESGQTNIIIQNNIGTMATSSNFTGISYEGNVYQSAVVFIQSDSESSFHLRTNKQATGNFITLDDFGGVERTSPYNVGAWE